MFENILKFKEGISKSVNYALWGTENPSPIQKSIKRQYRNKKLKRKINRLLDKLGDYNCKT